MNPTLKDDDEPKQMPIDWETVSKQAELFKKMAFPYFKEEKSARVLLAVVICFTLANSGVSVGFSYLSRDFWTALSSKNADTFYPLLAKYAAALAGGTPITVLYKFYREKFAVQWRSWMTQRLLSNFEKDRSYYVLESSGDIDNPDQRIAEDANTFTSVSLAFTITLLTSVIDLASFSTILYSIYPELFGAILLYAGFGTGCTLFIGSKLVGLNFEQLQREADFRFSLVRMRENAESIAFYGGEKIEMAEIQRRLQRTIKNYGRLIGAQRNLETFTVAYRYMVQVIPAWVVAPLYFKGKIELGVVSQSYGAFNHILSDLSIIVNQFEGISSFAAGIGRLGDFVDAMEKSQQKAKSLRTEDLKDDTAKTTWESKTWFDAFKESVSLTGIVTDAPNSLETLMKLAAAELNPLDLKDKTSDTVFSSEAATHSASAPAGEITSTLVSGAVLDAKDVTVKTPDNARTLVSNLNLKMESGQHLLIVGNSGAGKSSLLRTIAGLWSAGSGHITRPPPGETFFLPQRPYCTLGSLREQLLYPRIGGDDSLRLSDEELLSILRKVRLPELAPRLAEADGGSGLDSVRDWSAMLSLGEQQRLAFGRLLANQPRLAILDEASSALDLESEKAMYQLLEEVPGLTYVSVGHRPSLLAYHDTKLKLLGSENGFELQKINSAAEEEVAAYASLKL